MDGRHINVGRLSIRVEGVEGVDPRAFAQAVALRLAASLALAPGEGAIDRLQIEERARDGEPAGDLASRAAARTAAALAPRLEHPDPDWVLR